jgi:DNA-damage-inducible protein J
MSKSGTVQVRMPEDLKQEVNSILNTLGLTPSEAVLLYYKQIALNHGLPFEVKVPNKQTAEAIKEARAGEGLKKYASADDLFQDLNN